MNIWHNINEERIKEDDFLQLSKYKRKTLRIVIKKQNVNSWSCFTFQHYPAK